MKKQPAIWFIEVLDLNAKLPLRTFAPWIDLGVLWGSNFIRKNAWLIRANYVRILCVFFCCCWKLWIYESSTFQQGWLTWRIVPSLIFLSSLIQCHELFLQGWNWGNCSTSFIKGASWQFVNAQMNASMFYGAKPGQWYLMASWMSRCDWDPCLATYQHIRIECIV